MFGPGVHTLQGQRVVLCAGRGEDWYAWLKQMLDARGLTVTEATAEEHDRAMALVQVLTHFQTQVLGLGAGAHRRVARGVAALHLAGVPDGAVRGRAPLRAGPVALRTDRDAEPEHAEVTDASAAQPTSSREILAQRDQARFDRMFEEVRAFFGDFAAEATEQSSFLIDRLVERTLG